MVALDELVARWRSKPDAAATVALCDALARSPDERLAGEIGERATQDLGGDAGVLVAVARMYVGVARYNEAQTALVSAGKVAPRDASVYRWLGEVLLRKGDAERAEKVLDRAVQLGSTDPEARVWLDRAQVFKPMQARGGPRAVAAEIARTAPSAPRAELRPQLDSVSDEPTAVLPADLRAQVRAGSKPVPAAGAPPPLAKAPSQVTEESVTQVLPDRELRDLRSQLAGPLPAPSPPPMRVAPPAPPPLGSSPSPLDAPASGFSRGNLLADMAPPLRAPPEPSRARMDDPSRPRYEPERPRYEPDPTRPRYEPATRSPVASSTAAEVGRAPYIALPHVPVPAREVTDDSIADGRIVARPPLGPTAPPALGPPAAGKPVLPHPRDVLDALALAGVFEPNAVAGPPATWAKPETPRRRGALTLVSLLFLVVAGGAGIFSFVKQRREKAHVVAEAILQRVDADLHAGTPQAIEPTERALARAFELDSRNPRAALFWVRERGLKGLVKDPDGIAFEDSIARAKEVGVVDEYLAFARLASFLFQNDTAGAAGQLQRLDATAASQDAWYQLLAGATLERAGDGRAVERYIAAQRLAPQLLVAQIALARIMALEGDPARGMELAKELRARFPDRPEGAALVALAWGKNPGRTDPSPPELEEVQRRAAELPLSLAAVPHAVVALRAAKEKKPEEARAAIQRGLAASDGPGMAAWFGELALELGDEALARKAALTAVQFSTSYPPARMLAGRVALVGDRLDEAVKATEELEPAVPEVALVRAATAYERVDADAVARALEPLSPEARRSGLLAGIVPAADVLSGRALSFPDAKAGEPKAAVKIAARVAEIAATGAPWADLVAVDLAMDAGDTDSAGRIVTTWANPGERPSRAVRASRFARMEDKLDVADGLSQAALAKGVATLRTISERVYVLVARGKSSEVAGLVSRYPAVLGPMATWLSAYALAAAGKTEEARGRSAQTDPPPPLAPLPARLCATLSLGTMHDRRRGPDAVRELWAGGVGAPELTLAAAALGIRRK